MTEGTNRTDRTRAVAVSMRNTTLKARRSTSGTSEHSPLLKASGSMGTTRSTRYTLVPRV